MNSIRATDKNDNWPMVKRILSRFGFVLLLLISIEYKGQTSNELDSEPVKESRWRIGGSLGLGGSFGSGGSQMVLGVSPRIGYRIGENLELGVKVSGTWQNSKYYTSSLYSFGPYLHYDLIENLYLNSSFMMNFLNQKDKLSQSKYTDNEPALWLGLGYALPMGNTMYMHFGAQYNILYKKTDSMFSSGFQPSVGFSIGL